MILFRPLFRLVAQVYFVLSANFALSSLQNVTVDDAVLSGDVIPQYLPFQSAWRIGNNCSSCRGVQPNPALAYDGTWHDVTYNPSNAVEDTPGVQFTFIGSGLYVFFIIANDARDGMVHTLTSVDFVLDDNIAGSYTQKPLPNTTDYRYNVVVYANDSLGFGQHTMSIGPKDTGNISLILFDYFIYTTEEIEATRTWAFETPTTTETVTKSSASNVGYIVGGTVGGVAALLLLVVCLFYCRMRCKGSVSDVVEAYIISRKVTQTPRVENTLSIGSPIATLASRRNTGRSHMTLQPLIPPPPSASPPSPSTPYNNASSSGLLEQVELLRGEVARLRQMQDLNRDTLVSCSTAPPDYASR